MGRVEATDPPRTEVCKTTPILTGQQAGKHPVPHKAGAIFLPSIAKLIVPALDGMSQAAYGEILPGK